MTVNIIVQARMGSARLPGKVLRPAHGKPMLAHLLGRVDRSELASHVVLAVPHGDDQIIDAVWDMCDGIHQGDELDVAARYATAVRQFKCEAFVRVCGDSPLIDPGIIDFAISTWRQDPTLDMVSNTHPNSYPAGQCVEVVRTETFLKHQPEFLGSEREHVTPYFYARPDKFRIANFGMWPDMSATRMVVDTLDDFAAFEEIVDNFEGNIARVPWQSFLRP